ncbi:MAG: PAS domain S-box protein [Pseudomonadota bacterium]|nr:PAS domain S-box protein [Pseudomonadota bacterium]
MSSTGSRSIKFRITVLVALIMAPLLIIFGLVVLSLATANRAAVELQRHSSSHQLSAAVDLEFVELKGLLTGIATSVASSPSSNLMIDQQLANQAGFARIMRMWSFSSTGNVIAQYTNTLPDSRDQNLTSDFISRVFAGGYSISEVRGEGVGKATIVIAVPVFSEKNKVESGLAAEIGVSVFNRAFDDAGMSNSWVAAVIDQKGNFVARSLDAERKVGTAARPELALASHEVATSGTFENVTFEGTPVLNSFERSSLTEWTSVVAVPKSELAAPFQRALIYIILGGLGALGLSIFAASIMAATIANPVANLSRYATSLAQGQKVEPEKYHITEIENVKTSLNAAMAKSARLTALVASSGDAVIGVDLNGNIEAWNKGAETLFGYSADDIIGKPKSILVPQDLRAEFDAQRPKILAGEIVRAESVRLSRDGRRIDIEFVDAPITDSFGATRGYSTIIRDISERAAARDHRQLLMRELAHRTKNQLAIIQSIAQQTRRNTTSRDGFIKAFNGRIQGLAASHDILAKQQWQAIPIKDLVKSQVGVLVSEIDKSIVISGPDIALTPVHAEALGLALHELTTNSIKYGALSVAKGLVAITWRVANEPSPMQVFFEWQESGGPKIKKPPVRQGFGTRVLNNIVALSLGGEARMEYRPEGLHWQVNWELRN